MWGVYPDLFVGVESMGESFQDYSWIHDFDFEADFP